MTRKLYMAFFGGFVSLVLSLFTTFAFINPAIAHAELIGSDPAAGSQLETAPTKVSLEFGEDLLVLDGSTESNQILVSGPEQNEVHSGSTAVEGSFASVELMPSLPDGRYLVAYRVVSIDGHPIEGSFNFDVGQVPVDSINEDAPSSEDKPAGEVGSSEIIAWALGATLVIGIILSVTIVSRRERKP